MSAGNPQTVTLVAATVATVTLDAQYDRISVICHGDATADVYFTVDGTTPVAKANDCYFVAATPAADARLDVDRQASGATVVKLLSTAIGTVTVVGTLQDIG